MIIIKRCLHQITLGLKISACSHYYSILAICSSKMLLHLQDTWEEVDPDELSYEVTLAFYLSALSETSFSFPFSW